MPILTGILWFLIIIIACGDSPTEPTDPVDGKVIWKDERLDVNDIRGDRTHIIERTLYIFEEGRWRLEIFLAQREKGHPLVIPDNDNVIQWSEGIYIEEARPGVDILLNMQRQRGEALDFSTREDIPLEVLEFEMAINVIIDQWIVGRSRYQVGNKEALKTLRTLVVVGE